MRRSREINQRHETVRTNFANPPSEKFAWWTRVQILFTDRQVKTTRSKYNGQGLAR